MEKLAVFKLIDDTMELCGFFDSKEDAVEYLSEVKKVIDTQMQNNLAGEYIMLPSLYYKLNVAGQ